MGRRILNRKEMRADFDAAERRNQDGTEAEESDLEEDEEEEEEESKEEGGDAVDEAGDEEPKEEAPKKKKPAKPAKPKSRSRAAKIQRMKVVWGVFNNSNQRVAVFDYPKRADADALVAKLKADKKSTHFVQPVKEPIEEKKDEE